MRIRIQSIFALTIILIVSGFSFAQENNNAIDLNKIDSSLLGETASFLEVEAGMSAYVQVNGVDLGLAEKAYKNIEKKTSEYIIGSVSLINYPETDDVHVYVDESGWVIAYYLKTELPSKIFDWVDYRNQSVISTKLDDALSIVCAEMYISLPTVNYYDFRYPEATNIMIVVDEIGNAGTETFNIMMPSLDYFVMSRTWTHAIYRIHGYGDDHSWIQIDGTTLNHKAYPSLEWNIWEGGITPLQLAPDTIHVISLYNSHSELDAYVGIVLIYKHIH